ncbi:NAD(+) diphosphatase [Actinomyces sp. B33]|uniref:NAD(+) diphosphatase n=1 Tax=Actinomyces sp. B33 TaxID=2942131 RepID=UPI00233FDD58|nr:NAD(+) diphosphatase [Actinomyces sp. B33]MDC4233859.1 NAD(+) diphosphatase [Actinomyces sp. B33]
MRCDLPLARGGVDPLVPVRESVDPVRLVREGPSALTGAAGRIGAVRVLPVTARGWVGVERGGEGPRLASIPLAEAERLIGVGRPVLFLGATGDAARLALVLDADDEPRSGPWRWAALRWCGHLLGDDDAALAAAAAALAAWHDSFRYCPRCAAPVEPRAGGWSTACTGCGAVEFPRHDPAIIVLVVDGRDRALLAHNTAWSGSFASAIAGFVEAGESPDRAVAREVREEVGLEVRDVEYLGSQPWPFPRSQMLGYRARTVGAEAVPVPDGQEIEWARFYSREDLAEEIRGGRLEPPGRASIASAMLRDWYGGELPEPPGAPDPLRRP